MGVEKRADGETYEYERKPCAGAAGRHFDQGRERHGGSRAGRQNAARLSDRGNRRHRRAAFQKYAEKVPETLAPFRGSFHYVVRGGKTQALAWYNSPAYEAIKPIRQGASISRMFMAEGLPPQ